MIKKIRAKKEREQFSTLDIETVPKYSQCPYGKCYKSNRSEGDLLAIRLYDGKELFTFYSWGELLQFLEDNNKYKRFRKLIAHNGGGFDWVHLFQNEIENLNRFKIITANSNVIFAVINDFKHPVKLCDSILVLQKGLKVCADSFEVENRKLHGFPIQEIEYHFDNNRGLFDEYLDNDVISLFQVIQKFMDILQINKWPMTAAGLSMNLFKTRFLDEDTFLWKPSLKKDKKAKEKDEFFEAAYAGGRVECFRQGEYSQVYVYDINSLYPSVMEEAEIPVSMPVKTMVYMPHKVGFYKIEFEQTNRNIPPILWEKNDTNGLEFVYSGKGVFSHIEIANALKYGVKMNILGGCIFPKTKKIFKGFVNHFYKWRLDNYNDAAINIIAKIILNSLYGKFAQKEEVTHLAKMTSAEFWENLERGIKMKDFLNKTEIEWENTDTSLLMEVTENKPVAHRMVYISAIITALARTKLYDYIIEYHKDLIYCDTDSIHLTRPMDERLLSKELGWMKEEYTGPGVYIGRKQYAVGKTVKFKGLSLGSSLSESPKMTLEDLKHLLNDQRKSKFFSEEDGTMIYENKSFAKIKGVLRGKKAGKVYTTRKRLKLPDYTSNFMKN